MAPALRVEKLKAWTMSEEVGLVEGWEGVAGEVARLRLRWEGVAGGAAALSLGLEGAGMVGMVGSVETVGFAGMMGFFLGLEGVARGPGLLLGGGGLAKGASSVMSTSDISMSLEASSDTTLSASSDSSLSASGTKAERPSERLCD